MNFKKTMSLRCRFDNIKLLYQKAQRSFYAFVVFYFKIVPFLGYILKNYILKLFVQKLSGGFGLIQIVKIGTGIPIIVVRYVKYLIQALMVMTS